MNLSSRNVSQSAKDWATLALDPYHDLSVQLEGLPDEQVGRSYVRCHNMAQTISPAADGANISITFTGFHGPQDSMLHSVDTRNIAAYGPTTTLIDLAPIMVIEANSGFEPTPASIVTSPGSVFMRGLYGTCFDGALPSRLIGFAVEVHDVSASLIRKGTLTAVHCSGNSDHLDLIRYMHTPDIALYDPYFVEHADSPPMLPDSLTQLQSFPSLYTGAAQRGVYIVSRMNKPACPAVFASNVDGGWRDDALNRPFHSYALRYTSSSFLPGANVEDVGLYRTRKGPVLSGFQPFVINLSGLPEAGEYRITFRAYVEYFPEPSDLVALAIATPSPTYEPTVLTAYHDAAALLPVAVPVSMNAAGDWWRTVISVLRKVADRKSVV